MMPQFGELPIDAVAAGTCFATEAQWFIIQRQPIDHPSQGRPAVGDGAAPLRVGASELCGGYRDGVLMDIKTHIGFIF